MKDWAAVQVEITGVFPDVLAKNSTGAATQDGTEYIAEQINNGIFGWMQDFMEYASLIPNGVIEANGASQIREAIQLGNAIGPGLYVQWGKFDDPSVTGDRVLLLSGQGVLIATFIDLVDATYVGDGNNATAPFFFKATTAAGTIRDTAGPFFILPPENPTYRRQYSQSDNDFTITGTGWATISAICIPYKLSDNVWRLIINIYGSANLSAVNTLTLTISGVTFRTGYNQALSLVDENITIRAAEQYSQIRVNGGASTFTILWASNVTSNDNLIFSGNVELDSEPTWTDGHTFPWGITF